VDLGDLELSPCYHPMSHLVYAASRGSVTDVWVRGQRLLDGRRLTTLDPRQLAAKAQQWQIKITPQA
jgi:5-methylthioadenosine/S-adenosylhomocysteine deaminase